MKIATLMFIFGTGLLAQTAQKDQSQTKKNSGPTIVFRHRGPLDDRIRPMIIPYIARPGWSPLPLFVGADAIASTSEPSGISPQRGMRTECEIVDAAARPACVSAEKAFYESQGIIYQQGGDTYKFELVSAWYIFAMVLVLVASGLIFAGLQFYHALFVIPSPKRGRRTHPSPDLVAEAPKELETDLVISKDGLKVHSSVVGLLLLIVSMGFFYLYIRYVYPIAETEISQSVQANAKVAAAK